MKERMIGWLMVWVILFVGAGAGSDWYSQTLASQLKEPLNRIRDVLLHGVDMFSMFEKRAPNDLKELCASDYIPVACSDIVDSYVNRPILEVEPGKGFEVSADPERPPTGTLLIYTFPSGKKQVSRHPWGKFTPQWLAEVLKPESVKGWTSEMKVALSVSRYVNLMMWDFRSVHRRLPASLEEFKKFGSEFYYLSQLRNAFTGKFADVVSIACTYSLPTEGELTQSKIEDGTIVFCEWKKRTGTPLAYPVAGGKIFTAKCNAYPAHLPAQFGVCSIH